MQFHFEYETVEPTLFKVLGNISNLAHRKFRATPSKRTKVTKNLHLDFIDESGGSRIPPQVLVDLKENMEHSTKALNNVLEEMREVNRGFRKMEHLILGKANWEDRDILVDPNQPVALNKKMVNSQVYYKYNQFVTIKKLAFMEKEIFSAYISALATSEEFACYTLLGKRTSKTWKRVSRVISLL